MLPKLLAIDLDGTVFNSKGIISKKNKQMLCKLESLGVQIVIATGRGIYSATNVMNEIGIKGYIIGLNGASIFHVEEREPLQVSEIPYSIINKIMAIGSHSEVNIYLNTVDSTHLILRDYQLYEYFGIKKEFKIIDINEVKIMETENIIISKILFSSKNSKLLAKCYQNLSELNLEVVYPDSLCVEVTLKGINKASGLELLSQYLGISAQDMVAIGDSENDLSMIKYVGHGMAMGNAMESVKQVADEIIKTNDEDGIAEAIEELILKSIII
ncbi:MAG: Cof-type HAD-IIB family hydrolase [Carnobacterium sp.]